MRRLLIALLLLAGPVAAEEKKPKPPKERPAPRPKPEPGKTRTAEGGAPHASR